MSDGGLLQLLAAMQPELRRFLAARRVTPDEQDDLLQDLHLKLSQRETGPIDEPRAYLYRTANNLLLDRRRAEQRREARDRAWSDARPDASLDRDETPSPERIVAARDELRRVNALLDALPERTGVIFRAFRFEGLAQKQIAEVQGISLSAVEKHLQRAYRAILDLRSEADADQDDPRRLLSQGRTK